MGGYRAEEGNTLTRGDRFTALWSYPWDWLAEGPDESLGRIADAGIQGISLAVSYHAGMALLPHNPRQKVRFLEDGALYFRSRPASFRGLAIQPRVSALADPLDPLETLCRAAERQGLEVVAWTICCHNTYQGERHPELALQNAFGDVYPFALCPAQPEVQAYLEALLRDLSAYPVRALQLESCGYMGFYHGFHHEKIMLNLSPVAAFLLGLCFCPACLRAAKTHNLDGEALRYATQRYLEAAFEDELPQPRSGSREAVLDELPALEPYLALRDRIEADLVLRLSRVGKPLSLLELGPRDTARHMDEVGPHLAELTTCAYAVSPDEVARAVRAARARAGPALRLAIGLEATPRFSPSAENLAAKVRAAWAEGAEALYCYNYGLMPRKSLHWLAEALRVSVP